jgi:hypothetical protein
MSFRPIFKSQNGNITDVKYFHGAGEVFIFSEEGVVSNINELPINPFGKGLNYVFAQIVNGEGDISSVANTSIYYDLYNAIVKSSGIGTGFDIIEENTDSFRVSKNTRATAVYTSDVLKADEDFGFWKSITWTQNSSHGRVVVALKVAETEADVIAKDWEYYISEEAEVAYGGYALPSTFVVNKDLDRFNLKGRFMMFKVDLETETTIENPIVSEFIITYGGKHSVFFFTRKIKIEKNSNVDDMLLTASTSIPENTEIRFGVTSGNSSNWQDYKIIDLDKVEDLSTTWGSSVKVGIKLSSYSDVSVPVVQEIAFLLGADSDNVLD